MGFGTENHGLNLQFTSGLFRQVEWPIHCILEYSGPGVTGLLEQMVCIYASGRLDKFHCIQIQFYICIQFNMYPYKKL